MRHPHHYRTVDPELQRLREQRALAREGFYKASLLANPQPSPDPLALSLPFRVTIAPTWKTVLLLMSASVLPIILLNLCVNGLTTDQTHTDGIALTAYAMIVLVATLFNRTSLILTEDGIAKRDFLSTRRLRWDEIVLFARDLSPTITKILHYEVSDASGTCIIAWTYVRGTFTDVFRMPTIPYEQYNKDMSRILSLIAAKTGLPLYDLSKTYTSYEISI